MDHSLGSWSTAQLIEFLAQVAHATDETAARRAAVERVLEALDAEVGALIDGDEAHAVVGLGPENDSVAALAAVACRATALVDLPGLGRCRTASVSLDATDSAARLVIARVGTDEFVSDELMLLRGMAWVLHLALQPLRTLRKLDERRVALDQISTVQHAIANRAPLPEVLDMVTEGLLALFDNELAAVYVADSDHLEVASVSSTLTMPRRLATVPALGAGIGTAAYRRAQPVRADGPAAACAPQDAAETGVCSALATPIRENGSVVGSLVVASFRPGEGFSDTHERTLRTFADQISVALSDAKTLATAQHALRDPVTGLPNRVLFLQRLESALGKADTSAPTHVLFLDLDRFKLVNDTLGHAIGDDLLRHVGRRLRDCLSSTDCLARFGGDEYAVLIDEAPSDAVRQIGERMLEALRAPYLIGEQEVIVGGSIGVASGHRGCDAGDLLRDADTAMYRAKHTGGDSVVVFEKSMHTSLVQRVSLEADLRRALDNGELHVVFQPIVRLTTGEVHSAEALARWQRPGRGPVSPAEFIPLAEETGLIVAIGRQMLAAACTEAAAWPADPAGRAPSVSVNLSARQLHHPDLVAAIRDALDGAGLAADRLILEITESGLMTDADGARERLHQIRDVGVRVAIDDFGTGYSSLSYLRTFPVDIVKIDRSFVDGGVAGWQGEAFLGTIVRLTEALSMTAVGEGIETVDQLRMLRELRCELGQGYLFARPMPPAEFHERLTAAVSSDTVEFVATA